MTQEQQRRRRRPIPMEERRRNVVPWMWELHVDKRDGVGYVCFNEHRNRKDARWAARNYRQLYPGRRTRIVKVPQAVVEQVAQQVVAEGAAR